MMTSAIETLKTWITESDNIVFFGGAGVSTESGIPDFRSTDGLYHQKFDYPPETILSHTFFYQHPEYFFKFYREKMLPLDYQPNEAHKKLAALEQAGKLRAIVTQNIDGLHQKAGSKCVYELHGSVYRNYCEKCGKFYPPEYIRDSAGVPPLHLRRADQAGRGALRGKPRPDRDRGRGPRDRGRGGFDRGRHVPDRLPRGGAHPLLPRKQARAHQPR